jgi:AraC-like DNA-binding protein
MPISRQRREEAAAPPTATVSSEYLRLFAAGAQTRGLDVQPILTASGIDAAILGRRGARVAARKAAEVWKRSTKRLDDPLFGLTLFEKVPMGVMNLLDYVVISSAHVGDGLGRLARYAPLMGDAESLTLTVHGNEARFRFQNNGNDIPYPIEMIVGIFLRRSRFFFGPEWTVKRVCFAHPPLGPRATYDRICQVPISFDMPFTEVVFTRDLLALPIVGADPHLNAILAAEADVLLAPLASPPSAPSFIDTVKRVLEQGINERDLTLTRLADGLGISTRTLQRRLRAAGVTHRGLVRDVRQNVATRSLSTHASLGQIARSLGYSGTGAFQRAFKRWSGMTPGQVRRTRVGGRHGAR